MSNPVRTPEPERGVSVSKGPRPRTRNLDGRAGPPCSDVGGIEA
jgi:hypothetical protein